MGYLGIIHQYALLIRPMSTSGTRALTVAVLTRLTES